MSTESMPEKSTSSKEAIAPKTPEQTLVELLSGLSDPEEVKKIREAFVAGKEEKAEDLVRMTLQTNSPETVRRLRGAFNAGKEKMRSLREAPPEPPRVLVVKRPAAESAEAGEPEEVRVVPKPVVPEAVTPTPERRSKVKDILDPEERAELAAILKEETRGWDLGREIPKKDIAELWHRLSQKSFLGTRLIDLASGAGIGFLVRNATRHGLGVFTGGAGYAIGAISGAAAGAATGAYSAYRREKGREIAQDEIVEKAREAGDDLKAKLDSYLKLIESEESRGLVEIGGEKDRLYQEFRKEFGARRSEIIKGALYGALTGAVGGYIGTWIADYFFSGTGGGGKAAEQLVEAKKAAKAAGGEALRQQIEAAATEASGKAYENAVKAGVMTLDAESFGVLAERGDGATHLARKLIHDYITERQALLGKKFVLPDKAELVYAEDYLRRELFKGAAIEPHKMFRAPGKKIAEALGKAFWLTNEETANLNKNWIGKISTGTWKAMQDYKTLSFQGNDFSKEIFERARESSAAAAKKAGAEMGRTLAAPRPSPAASAAAGSWFNAATIKWGLGAIGTGLALGTAWRFRETIVSGAGKAGRTLARGAGRAHELIRTEVDLSRPFSKIAEGGTLVRRMAGALRRQAGGQETPAGPVADVDAQRREAEETQRREAQRLEAAQTEAERVEHEKKLAADPVRKLFQEFGQTIEPRDGLTYKALPKEAIDAGQGTAITFNNYSDFCKHSRSLTPDQRAKAERWETTLNKGAKDEKKYPTVGVWANESFWDKLEADPELKKRFFEISPKIKRGIIEDTHYGLEGKEDPRVAIGALIEELKTKHKDRVFHFERRWDNRMSPEEELEGLRKLSRVLEGISSEEVTNKHFFYFMIGTRAPRFYGTGLRLEIDPSLSEEEMRNYIFGSMPKIEELGGLAYESSNLRRDIQGTYGFRVFGADYENVDVQKEIESLKVLKEALVRFPLETLTITDKTTVLRIGQAEVRKNFGEPMISIPPGLSVEETRQFLASAAEEVEIMRKEQTA